MYIQNEIRRAERHERCREQEPIKRDGQIIDTDNEVVN